MATPNRRTFSLQTPADLYRKLNFEALELHNNPPNDLERRAYAVMNAVTTAWQMKDWVYEAPRGRRAQSPERSREPHHSGKERLRYVPVRKQPMDE